MFIHIIDFDQITDEMFKTTVLIVYCLMAIWRDRKRLAITRIVNLHPEDRSDQVSPLLRYIRREKTPISPSTSDKTVSDNAIIRRTVNFVNYIHRIKYD